MSNDCQNGKIQLFLEQHFNNRATSKEIRKNYSLYQFYFSEVSDIL